MRRVAIAITVLFFLGTVTAAADIYIKQKSHSDAFAMMGQETPEKNDIFHMWLGDDKMALQMPDMGIVIDLEKNVMIWIMHEDKSYVEMELPLQMEKYFPPQMMQMMQNVEVTVSPTDEKKQIAGWECEGYDMTMNVMNMMEMKQKIWASSKVPFDWKDYAEKMLPKLSQAMLRLSEESLQEMMKIQGFQIRTETSMSMMGNEMKSWQEVEEIVKKDAPAGTYSAPKGYTKKDKLDFMDLQRD